MMNFRRRIVGGVLAIAMGGFALTTSQAANAAPMNCAGPDAPPACHHAPPPTPPAPAVLQTVAFSPVANIPNDFWVQVEDVAPSSVAAFSDGSVTTFRMSVSCSNGFFRSGPMTLHHYASTHLRLTWSARAGAGEASGSCFATTWDQAALGVAHTTIYPVVVNPETDPTGAGWHIEFGPGSWAPMPNSN